jgi:hypothetical protein
LETLVEKDYRNFSKFTDYGIKMLSEKFLMNMCLDNKKTLLGRMSLLKTFPDKFVVNFVLTLAEQTAVVKKVPFYQEIDNNIINSLSKSQINLMKEINKEIMNNQTFVRSWFELNFLQIIEKQLGEGKKKVTLKQMD